MNWPFWGELLLRSAVILATGEVLRRCCRAGGPVLRHRLLLWTFLLLASLPLLLLVLPQVPVSFLTAAKQRASVTVSERSYMLTHAPAPVPVDRVVWLWMSGALLALVPVVTGAFAARRIARRAAPLRDNGWSELLGEIATPRRRLRLPQLLISSEVLAPLTCGVMRPRILLPAAAREWNAHRRRAVLLHELAHIERRDVATQLVVHIIAALWWFQPLVWLLRRGLRAESEMACDASALGSGLRPSEYAAELLGIAQGMQGIQGWARLSSAGISMARTADLEARLRLVLNPQAPFLSRAFVRGALLVLMAIALGASTVTSNSQHSQSLKGGFMIKRPVLSGLLASVGLSAASISGSIFDPSGAVIPDAKLLLYNPDNGAKQEVSSGPDGRFNLDDTPAGQYILRVEKPGFAPLFREFNLKADSKIDRGLTMALGSMQEEVTIEAKGRHDANSIETAPPTRIRVGGRVEQSNLINKVQPVYPGEAKSAGLQGVVELEAVISKEGVPLEIRVVSSPGESLSQSALEAVRQWRYRPVLLNGNPVEVVTDVIVNYTLSE
jgi:TonB family protein